MPHRGETSVFRVDGLSSEEVWDIGIDFVARNRRQALKGRADLDVAHVLVVNLKVEPDTTPHPRHANIVDWPAEKHEQKMMATKLASVAATSPPPNQPV